MNGFRTTVRRALDRARRRPTALARPGRWPLVLGLAATLLMSALVPPAPVRAADPLPEPPKPAARVQVVVKEVYIWDDRDPGDGEMTLRFEMRCFAKPTPCLGRPEANLDGYERHVYGSTGDTVTLGNLLPQSREKMLPEYDGSVEAGYPLYLGQNYQLRFEMSESDYFSTDEDMGERWIFLSPENGWGIGQHRLRSTRVSTWGDFEIEFEVRAVPLPDFRPVDIKAYDLPGSTNKLVCVAIENDGPVEAGPFEYWLFVDGLVRPEAAGNAGRLAAATSGELCGNAPLSLSPGPHQIKAVVDPIGGVIEFNETNNVYERAYLAAAAQLDADPASGQDSPPANADANGGFVPPSSPAPDPGPSSAQADLTVSAIKVNGQAPDGKDDCKDGQNGVAVVVTNAGKAKAEGFAVRLVVDAARDDAMERSVSGLEAGQEREVRFEEVRLKKGEHELSATAAGKSNVGESKDDNNELKVTARCKDAA
jgi:hypothetical protein